MQQRGEELLIGRTGRKAVHLLSHKPGLPPPAPLPRDLGQRQKDRIAQLDPIRLDHHHATQGGPRWAPLLLLPALLLLLPFVRGAAVPEVPAHDLLEQAALARAHAAAQEEDAGPAARVGVGVGGHLAPRPHAVPAQVALLRDLQKRGARRQGRRGLGGKIKGIVLLCRHESPSIGLVVGILGPRFMVGLHGTMGPRSLSM